MTTDSLPLFNELALSPAIAKILDDVGYETPSPIQAKTIPLILEGKDVLGQAQTGTGKTAAFALPILTNLNLKQKDPQVLVLTPTRELAIQVAEAFQKYATHIKGFRVLPIYGGQDYRGQIRSLERGVHVVVGTPGRVMDHMRRKTLKLGNLTTLVLDEADEMLRMGFIDDVEWILEQTPENRQTALFSATMPTQIKRIASKYLNNPEEVTIKVKTTTADTIRQHYWPVSGAHKLDALTRILEAEPFEAMIIFVKTKTSTVDLSEKLAARGFASSPLNGDIPQNQRERTVNQLKKGKLDILVATDVAARGLDVERISHVINYDIPHDTEAYVHRIGRTGRAGRTGDAILFVAPREKRLLGAIERATRKKIELMALPSTEIINKRRTDRFKQRITDTLENENLTVFANLVEEYKSENDVPPLKIAAALAHLFQGNAPLLFENKPIRQEKLINDSRDERRGRKDGRDRGPRSNKSHQKEEGMQRYRIEVGHIHEVKPANIVGAIANEADLESQFIGRISIFDDHSHVDLPEGMPKEVLKNLQKAWVAGQRLNMSVAENPRKQSNSRSKSHSGKSDQAENAPRNKTKKRNKDKRNKGKPKKRTPSKD